MKATALRATHPQDEGLTRNGIINLPIVCPSFDASRAGR